MDQKETCADESCGVGLFWKYLQVFCTVLYKFVRNMNYARYQAELSVLSSKLSSSWYNFDGIGTATPSLRMAARTNGGNLYTLYFDLSQFPMSIPKVFVTKMLKTKNGTEMRGCSASMHTLSSEHGWTRICHYGHDAWTPNVSLYKVYIKCRLWLEMYEAHLRTGHEIDYYLNHQA